MACDLFPRQLQEREPDRTLTLNAGDYFQGTMWFNELGYEPIVKFSNLLNWTAMALGNHDFDLGSVDLADFSRWLLSLLPLWKNYRKVNYDLLATNLVEDEAVEDKIEFSASKVIPWNSQFETVEQVVEIDGHQIGLIGYITDLTPSITAGEIPNLTFDDVGDRFTFLYVDRTLRKLRV